MTIPLKVVDRGRLLSEGLADHIRERTEKLSHFFGGVRQCRVTVDGPGQHPLRGRIRVRVTVSVPGSEIAINRQTGMLEETPDVITRGFVLDARTEALVKEIPGLVGAAIEGASVEERTDPGLMKEKIRVDLQRFFRKRSGLRPFVLPVVMEI